MAQEHGVAGGPGDHGEHGEPHVGEGLGREAAVADAEHVRHRLEQRPRVLLQPVRLLQGNREGLEVDIQVNRALQCEGKSHQMPKTNPNTKNRVTAKKISSARLIHNVMKIMTA